MAGTIKKPFHREIKQKLFENTVNTKKTMRHCSNIYQWAWEQNCLGLNEADEVWGSGFICQAAERCGFFYADLLNHL